LVFINDFSAFYNIPLLISFLSNTEKIINQIIIIDTKFFKK